MTRFLTISLFLLIIFASCTSNSQTDIGEGGDNTGAVEFDNSEDYDINAKSNSGFYGALESSALATVNDYIYGLSLRDFISKEDYDFMQSIGIDIKIEDVKKINNDSFSFVLALENEAKNTAREEIVAHISYSNHSGAQLIEPINFDLYWGSLSYLNDIILVTTKENVNLYMRSDFSMQTVPLDFSSLGDIYLLATMPLENSYRCVYFNTKETGYADFSISGELIQSDILLDVTNGNYFANHNFHSSADPKNSPRNQSVNFFSVAMPKQLTSDHNHYYIRRFYTYINQENEEVYHNSNSFLIDFNKNKIDTSYNIYSEVVDDKNLVILPTPPNDIRLFVALYHENELIGSHQLKTDLLPLYFPYSEYNYYNSTALPFVTINGAVASITDAENSYSLTVDFDKGEHEIFINFTHDDLVFDENTPYSSDGIHSLHSKIAYTNGVDYLYYYAVHNANTDEIVFIDVHDGGAYSQIAFMENGDVFSFSNTKYKLFKRELGYRQTADFSEFLGSDENVEKDESHINRELVSVLRDDESNVFYALYADVPLGMLWNYQTQDDFFSLNYKIAMLDSSGKLIESYDTHQPIFWNFMGFQTVFMHKEGDKLIIIGDNFAQSAAAFRGEFNLNTKLYHIIEPQ